MRQVSTFLLAVLITISRVSFAQTPVPPKPVLGGDPVTLPPLINDRNQSLVSKRAFAAAVADRFSYQVTGDREFSTLGNFASVNVLKPAATVAFGGMLRGTGSRDTHSSRLLNFLARKLRDDTMKIRVLSGSFTGTGDQDLISLFSNDKVNSAFEGRVNYATLSPLWNLFGLTPGATKLYYEAGERERLQTQRLAATSAAKYERSRYFTQKRQLDSLRLTLRVKPVPAQIEPYSYSINTVEYKRSETYDKALAEFRAAHFKLAKDSLRFHSLELFKKTFADTIFSVDKSAKWSSVRLSWLDFFASAKQQNVQLYDPKSTFLSNKISEDKSFYGRVGIAANVSYSSEKYKRIFNGILRLEVSRAKNSNLNQLTAFEVSTAQKFDSANVVRTATRKVNAYDSKDFKISTYTDYRVDLLKQLTSNRRAYLRVVYNYSVPRNKGRTEAEAVPSTHDLTLGFLLAFTKKGEAKSLVNFQPYIKLRDFTNEYQKDLNSIRRSEIGILTTFPFGLPTPKAVSK